MASLLEILPIPLASLINLRPIHLGILVASVHCYQYTRLTNLPSYMITLLACNHTALLPLFLATDYMRYPMSQFFIVHYLLCSVC